LSEDIDGKKDHEDTANYFSFHFCGIVPSQY